MSKFAYGAFTFLFWCVCLATAVAIFMDGWGGPNFQVIDEPSATEQRQEALEEYQQERLDYEQHLRTYCIKNDLRYC